MYCTPFLVPFSEELLEREKKPLRAEGLLESTEALDAIYTALDDTELLDARLLGNDMMDNSTEIKSVCAIRLGRG